MDQGKRVFMRRMQLASFIDDQHRTIDCPHLMQNKQIGIIKLSIGF